MHLQVPVLGKYQHKKGTLGKKNSRSRQAKKACNSLELQILRKLTPPDGTHLVE